MFRLTFDQEKQLIDFFRENPSLWHTKDKDYNNRSLRTQKLETVASHLRLTRKDVYEKYRNLRTTFFREHKRVLLSSTSSNNSSNFDGSPSTDNGNSSNGPGYISKWRHYNNMLFLTKTGSACGGDGSYRTSSKNSDIAAGEDDEDSSTSDNVIMPQRQRQLSANLQNGHSHHQTHDIEMVDNNGNASVVGGSTSAGQLVILQHPKMSRHLSTQPIEILSTSSSANSVDLNSLVQTNNNSHHLHNEEQLIYVNESNGTVTVASRPMIATSNGTVTVVNQNNQLQLHHQQLLNQQNPPHHRLLSSSPIRTSTTSLPQQLSISPIVSNALSSSSSSSAIGPGNGAHSVIYTAATPIANHGSNLNRQIFKSESIENLDNKISPNILLKNLPFATGAAADLNSFLQKQLPTSSSSPVLTPQIIAKTSVGTSAAAALQQFQQSASSTRKSSLLLLTKPDSLSQPMAFVSSSSQQAGSASATTGGQFVFGGPTAPGNGTFISQNSSNQHHNGIFINGFAGTSSGTVPGTASSTPTSGTTTMDYSEMREVIKNVVQDAIVDYEDEEMAFCRSLAASLRTLDRSKKDVAKLELQQVIVRYTNPSYSCSSLSQLSTAANDSQNMALIASSAASAVSALASSSSCGKASRPVATTITIIDNSNGNQQHSSDINNQGDGRVSASDDCPTRMDTEEIADDGNNTANGHNDANKLVPTTSGTTIDNNNQANNGITASNSASL